MGLGTLHIVLVQICAAVYFVSCTDLTTSLRQSICAGWVLFNRGGLTKATNIIMHREHVLKLMLVDSLTKPYFAL